MRLIDAVRLINSLERWNTNDARDKAMYNFAMNRIIEQPIAYDVEAVVKELKELKRIEILGECPMESCSDCGTNCEGCYTTKAIEIVKGGVK